MCCPVCCLLFICTARTAAVAGPLFDSSEAMSFYNLELSDTNVVDHNTHDYAASNNTTFTVLEC
jgi:hypothetical protein